MEHEQDQIQQREVEEGPPQDERPLTREWEREEVGSTFLIFWEYLYFVFILRTIPPCTTWNQSAI